MQVEEVGQVIACLRAALDAMNRAHDALDNLPDGGITSITYTLRQIAIAVEFLGRASGPLTRELDR